MAEQDVFIIKRIKKGDHGHHGGAWKVAYADFVTAMMAFFLLLWLLSATSESQKEGIADYFTPDTVKAGENKDGAGAEIFAPTFGLKDAKGIGFKGGEKPVEEGQKKQDLVPPGIVVGKLPQGPIPQAPEKDTLIEADQDAKLFEKAHEDIKKTFEEDPNLRDFKDNIILEQTAEGLKIQIVDSDKHPMFEAGGALLTEFGKTLLGKMSEVIQIMPNHISITGHTDSGVFAKQDSYTNWELSADRANASRRFLMTQKMEPERVMKVVGMADKELLLPESPNSPRNRRISIILLRGSHLGLSNEDQAAPRALISVPKISDDALKTPKSMPMRKVPVAPVKPKPRNPDVVAPKLPEMEKLQPKPSGALTPSTGVPIRTMPAMPSGMLSEPPPSAP